MSAALAPRAIAVGARATRKPTKKNFRHALRAVVDSETPQGDQTKPMQVQRPTRDAVTLRPAGVSDAVVDSSKALEALAALGGNRTCSFRSFRSSRRSAQTRRAAVDARGDAIGEDTATGLSSDLPDARATERGQGRLEIVRRDARRGSAREM